MIKAEEMLASQAKGLAGEKLCKRLRKLDKKELKVLTDENDEFNQLQKLSKCKKKALGVMFGSGIGMVDKLIADEIAITRTTGTGVLGAAVAAAGIGVAIVNHYDDAVDAVFGCPDKAADKISKDRLDRLSSKFEKSERN